MSTTTYILVTIFALILSQIILQLTFRYDLEKSKRRMREENLKHAILMEKKADFYMKHFNNTISKIMLKNDVNNKDD